jgi:V8-like Glu-specific endopeptidase
MKIKVVIFLSLLLIQLPQLNASAVTYPDKAQVKPADAPFLLSIWTVDDESFARKDKICSAILFNQSLVITAAHCVIDDKGIAVVAGQENASDRGEVLSVYKWITHPRYSKKTYQNDIAVGLLNFNARINEDFSLTSSSKFIKNNTRLYGWGVDQNEIDNGLPMSVLQNNYSATAKKYYKNFNRSTQIAAGYYNPTERTFGGGCYGDSGGPLITKSNNSFQLLGVVSYGSGCDVKKPTVYTKVSHYYKWILETYESLIAQYKKDGTTRPNPDSFSLLPTTTETLPRQEGKSGYHTLATLQSGGGVKSPDIESIVFATYSGELQYQLSAYLTNELDPCIEKQKGSWLVQVGLSSKQNVDFQFSVPKSYGCYTLGKGEFNLAKVEISPPSQFVCNTPSVQAWNQSEGFGNIAKMNVLSFYFGKGCLGTANKIWIRIYHSVDGDGADLEPGGDMWAGPFTTAILGEAPVEQPITANIFYTAYLDKAVYAPGEIATLQITGKDASGNLVPDGTQLASSQESITTSFPPNSYAVAPKFADTSRGGRWTYRLIIGSAPGTYSGTFKIGNMTEQKIPYVVRYGG